MPPYLKRQYLEASTETDSREEHNRPTKIQRSDKDTNLNSAASSAKALIIFGDSYSTSFDGEEKTWVNFMSLKTSLEIENFAVPGATAEFDLDTQLTRFFVEYPCKKSTHSQPALDPERTHYVLFIGINDCGTTDEDDLEEIIEKVMDAVHRLYIGAGARNFVVMDVPPLSRTPGGIEDEDTLRARVNTWNTKLGEQVDQFIKETPRASVTLYSIHAAFTDIADNPEDYGFDSSDVEDEGGAIWADTIHATSAVH